MKYSNNTTKNKRYLDSQHSAKSWRSCDGPLYCLLRSIVRSVRKYLKKLIIACNSILFMHKNRFRAKAFSGEKPFLQMKSLFLKLKPIFRKIIDFLSKYLCKELSVFHFKTKNNIYICYFIYSEKTHKMHIWM